MSVDFNDTLGRAINAALEEAISEAMKDILEKSVKELSQRITESRSQIILNVMSYVDVLQDERMITIRLRDERNIKRSSSQQEASQ